MREQFKLRSYERRNIFLLLTASLFLLFCYQVVSHIYYGALSFDGAMNMQVPVNLLKYGRYAGGYNHVAFTHVETGSPLLLLALPFFWLFGISSFTAQLPNAIYLLLAAVLVMIYVGTLTNKWFGMLGLVVFMFTPYLLRFGLEGYGEVVAFFFLLAGLWIFSLLETKKVDLLKWAYLIGLLWGLAYLTKVVILIFVPSFLLVSLLDILVLHKLPKKVYLLIIFGWLSGVLSFEAYKFSVLGCAGWLSWWKTELSSVAMQAGISKGFKDTPSLWGRTIVHFSILSKTSAMPIWRLAIFLLVPYAMVTIKYGRHLIRRNIARIDLNILLMTGVSLSYFAWWLCITPTGKAWYRRILVGVTLQEILGLVVIGIFLVKDRTIKWRVFTYRNFLYGVLVLLLAMNIMIQLVQGAGRFRVLEGPTRKKTDSERIAAAVAHLPADAKIFGTGWWQAPLVALLSGRNLLDINGLSCADFNKSASNYFVVDEQAYFLGKRDIEAVLNRADVDLVERAGYYFLYRIKRLLPFPPFKAEKNRTNLLSTVDFSKADYPYVRGLYPYEKGFRWSRVSSAILLGYSGQRYLHIHVWIPKVENYIGSDVRLKVSVNDSDVKTYRVLSSGDIDDTFRVPAGAIKGNSAVVGLTINRQWKIPEGNPDKRKLAFVVREVGFVTRPGKHRRRSLIQ